MLPRNHRQEALSRAYVRAVAARAGVTCHDTVQDFGVDMLLRDVRESEIGFSDSGPQLDIQLKSTTRAEVRDTEVAYDLEVRAYNLLRQPVLSGGVRLLVLLLLPDDESQWLTLSEDELFLRRCAYWISLRGATATTATTTIRITIPRTNVFSPEAVRRLMDLIEQGRFP